MIKAIIFDVGGVLHADEVGYIYDDIKQTLKLSVDTFTKTYWKFMPLLQLGKISESKFWELFVRESGTGQALPKVSLLTREYIKRFSPNKDILKLVKLLKRKSYKLAVMSNTIAPHREYNEKRGIYDDFDVKIFSDEVGLKKPDPEIFKLTLQKLQVEPKEAVYIDDIPDYVKAAKKLGIYGLLFTSSGKLESDLRQLKVI